MTDHLKIPALVPLISYTGNGSQTVFIYPFPIFSATDMLVSINGARMNGGYVVTNAGNTSGGQVIFNSAPENNARIVLERRLPYQRLSDFLEGGELPANALNSEFDYLTACVQQVDNDYRQALRAPGTDGVLLQALPEKATRANKVLGFDGNGQPVMVDTSTTIISQTYAQTGVGAISRPISDKLRESVSVKDFGAIGDGVTDDTSAVQNALNAHASVYFPAGTYRVTSAIEIPSNRRVFGAGPQSIIKGNSTSFDVLNLVGSFIHVHDLVVDTAESGVRLYGKTMPCRYNVVESITIKNCVIGIELDGYTQPYNPCDNNQFRSILIEKPTLHGVWLTKSGAGSAPAQNSFHHVHVISDTANTTGSGFYCEQARQNTVFESCRAVIAGTATACFRIGTAGQNTQIHHLYTYSTNSVPNIQLDAGSTGTHIAHLSANSNGAIILDNSGGNLTTLNAGDTVKNLLQRSTIKDLTTDVRRFSFQTIALGSAGTVTVDMTTSTYLVNATNGATTLQLPKAAAGNQGVVIVIKKTDASANLVLVTENTGNGPDNKTLVLASQNDSAMVLSDGSVWRLVHASNPFYPVSSVDGLTLYKPAVTKALHLVGCTAGTCTVELPPASAATSIGRILTIKKSDASANLMRITEEGATGPEGAVYQTSTRYQGLSVMSNGTAWYIVSKIT